MQRREFLKTPALGILLPGSLSMAGMSCAGPSGSGTADGENQRFSQHLHQDFETYIPGIEYFVIGNGDIMGVVQYAPDRSAEKPQTFLGLTIMDAEHFARKWSTFLFHPEDGFGRTILGVTVDGKGFRAAPENLVSIEWKYPDTVPVVACSWKTDTCLVEEEIFVPREHGLLFRRVRITNNGEGESTVGIWTRLCPSFALFDDIGVDEGSGTVAGKGFASIRLQCLGRPVTVAGRYDLLPEAANLKSGQMLECDLVYSIRGDEKVLTSRSTASLWAETAAYWREKPLVSCNDPVLDHLYGVARTGLKSQIARSGKRDSGIWMYNMQWVRDDVFVILGQLAAGFREEARTILTKILESSIGEDGRTIESSRWSGYEYAELDQNGQLLHGVWAYLAWTGDERLVASYWDRIRKVGSFLLLDIFRDPKSGLLHNKREFWERNDNFGVKDGFELAYQFWTVLGLENGAEIADRMKDHETATLWRKTAAAMKATMLKDPTYRMIERNHFIKRRTVAGEWQEYMIPKDPKSMPPGSPMATVAKPRCEPDSASVYPIVYEFVDPSGEVGKGTLDDMEVIWNQQWNIGGYARYNTTSEPDPPAPWPIASLLIARAAIEAGDTDRAWRVLRWLLEIHGGKSGGWFERYGPSITPPAPPVCIVGWIDAEISMLVVHHLMGLRPGLERLVIRPKLIDGITKLSGKFPVREGLCDLTVRRRAEGVSASVNGKAVPLENGQLVLGYPRKGETIQIEFLV